MHTPFIETDCTITSPTGQKFTSGGAYITDERAVAYVSCPQSVDMAGTGFLTDWHGNVLGTYEVTSSWWTGNMWSEARMYAITATINGRTYYGRTQGPGMVAYLKAHKNQKG